ncbi:SDR family oxidoreductase [bacterium 1XD42-1]|nr:SDR family oxidoreductase [bacterium 1XD42-8]RKJ64572.1 SDR family oxidoreductase [bacterium 1XD42-1]
MEKRLEGKNVIITGARKGIGRASVELFAKNGANIWACAKKFDTKFEMEMYHLAEQYKVWIKPVYFDLADENAISTALYNIIKEKEPIDILINNAAVSYGTMLGMMPISKIRQLFDVNFFAQLQMIQIIAKAMIKNKQGAIINLASVSGMEVYIGNLAYGASKAAVIYATKQLSKEYAPYGIRINAVAPGVVHTDMDQTRTEEQMREVLERTALKRGAQPEEIAKAILFLASEEASYITGSILVVDGGRIDF